MLFTYTMSENMENVFTKIKNVFEFVLEYLIQILQTTFVYLVFFSSKIYIHAAVALKKLCETYPEINEVLEKCNHAIKKIEHGLMKLFSNCRFEPEFSPWISITWLKNDNDISEKYFDFLQDENITDKFLNDFYYLAMKEYMQNSINGMECIIIMRHAEKTRCNIIDKYDDKNTYEQSNVKLLAIEYKHPMMKESILIELDRSWFLCGNQLLSNVFVRRYLDYQSASFYFDGEYTITLIDNNNMNITKIDQTQYVLIEKDTFRIIENTLDEKNEEEKKIDKIDSYYNYE